MAGGAVMVSMGDTIILVSVVGRKDSQPRDFLPLTVDYEERTYAAGRIPGGFFKREGRPSEKAILTCRLIDRPIRPLFPKGFSHDVQIIITVLSVDPEINPDTLAIVGASAALELSGIPFNGPVGAARVGVIDGNYVLNPTKTELDDSNLDLVVAGTESAVLMVESEAKILSEEKMLGAVLYGHEQMQTAITAIKELGEEAQVTPWDWQSQESDSSVADKVEASAAEDIGDAYRIVDKQERQEKLATIRTRLLEELSGEDTPQDEIEKINVAFKATEKRTVRGRIISGEPRIDGRDTRTVRPITIRTGIFPRTHGSASFTRGETQALVMGRGSVWP